MPTETYRGWEPWVCPGCSRGLQFSKAHGSVLQLFFLGVALLALYLLGLRGLQLFGAALAGGFVLTVVLAGPLGRVLPPSLEPYRPPPWKEPKFVTLFPDETPQPDSVKDSGKGQPE
jgi:hypothetical protein